MERRRKLLTDIRNSRRIVKGIGLVSTNLADEISRQTKPLTPRHLHTLRLLKKDLKDAIADLRIMSGFVEDVLDRCDVSDD